jgi:DNA repair exonuclease SbcCD ATPase subunit
MVEKIQELEGLNKSANARVGRWYALTALLFIALVVSSVFAAYKINEYMKQNKVLALEKNDVMHAIEKKSSEIETKNTLIEEKDKKVQEIAVKLEKNSEDFQKNIDKLKKEMTKQEKEFHLMLEKNRKEQEMAKQAEILEMRNKFAKERLELLKKLETVAQEKEEREKVIEKLRQQSHEQSVAIKTLSVDSKVFREKAERLEKDLLKLTGQFGFEAGRGLIPGEEKDIRQISPKKSEKDFGPKRDSGKINAEKEKSRTEELPDIKIEKDSQEIFI